MLGIDFNGQLITHHVNLVGVDSETYDTVSHFGRYLLHPENQEIGRLSICAIKVTRRIAISFQSRVGITGERVPAYEKALAAERSRIEKLDGSSNRRRLCRGWSEPRIFGVARNCSPTTAVTRRSDSIPSENSFRESCWGSPPAAPDYVMRTTTYATTTIVDPVMIFA